MQTLSLRIKSYRSWRINDRAPPEAIERIHKLELYDRLKQEGCIEQLRLESIGWSRATYYPRLCIRNLLHPKMTLKTLTCSKNNIHHNPAMFPLIFLARVTVLYCYFCLGDDF